MTADPQPADPSVDTARVALEARLDELQRHSDERRRELMALTAQLPAALSRRATVRALLSDAAHLPDKAYVMRRAVRKAVGPARRGLARATRRVRP